jgi:hypothetical protein
MLVLRGEPMWLKILGWMVVGFVNLNVLSILAVWRVQSEVREIHASFRVGQSVFNFRIPDSAERVQIHFFSDGEPANECGMAVTELGGGLLLIGETVGSKELPDRSQLVAVLRALPWHVERCTRMYVSISNWLISWPYNGTVKVHYEKGVVTKVEKPFFWD